MPIRHSLLLLLSFAFISVPAAGPTEPEPLAVTAVASGVYAHPGAVEDWLPGNGGDVANLGFVVGTRCVAVIDTGGTPEVGKRWREAIEQTTHLPICYVIDTHAHPDHVLGNHAFAGPGTEFVAGSHFNTAMTAREPFFLNALQRDFGIRMTHDDVVYPTLAVDRTLELDLGGRVLVLQAWPTAHTDNDITVFDRQTRTLFTGDLLFVQHIPVIDGSLRGWLSVMSDLARVDAATVVPGHGAVSTDWPAVMTAQHDYLDAVLRETRAAIKAGVTLGQATGQVGREAATRWLLADRFHRRNVTAAYAELEWED
jgi:quinoprotein relay system zinc metallohydrolase 2